jgi:hypothetical protein
MRTLTLDILDDKAMELLRDLESQKIIRIQNEKEELKTPPVNLAAKYSGAMSRQSLEDIDKQLNDLRNE